MYSAKLFIGVTTSSLLSPAFALSTNAPIVSGNPQAAQYIATLPMNESLPTGSLVVSSAPDGNGVQIQVSISHLPSYGGPFRKCDRRNAATSFANVC
jgi:hypothetical protein